MPETDVRTLKERLQQDIHWINEEDTIDEILQVVKKWLEQKKQYYEAQKELGADYWLYTHRQRVVDDLLKELER